MPSTYAFIESLLKSKWYVSFDYVDVRVQTGAQMQTRMHRTVLHRQYTKYAYSMSISYVTGKRSTYSMTCLTQSLEDDVNNYDDCETIKYFCTVVKVNLVC